MQRTRPKLSAVVVAGGLSRRMGAANKLLLPVDGVPLVRRVVATVASLPFVEIVVATGHEAQAVEAALVGLPVRIVHNPDYEQGQMTTVNAALAGLITPCDGIMVCLADQPALTTADLELIAEIFLATDAQVLVPTWKGMRGNPIVLSRPSFDAIVARGGTFGCRQFVAKNADLVRMFEMPNDHVILDIDRPEDYEALKSA